MVDIFAIAEAIIRVASGIFGLRDQFKSARRDRRDAISDLFMKLSDTLAETANSLEKGIVPHGACAEIETYAKMLPQTIGDFVDSKQVEEWTNELINAHRVENLSKVSSMNERVEIVAKLRGSAGMFEAIAHSLRAARP